MIFDYTAMPHGAPPRPLIEVDIGGTGLLVKGLVDTGAVSTLFGTWVADEAGVELAGAEERMVGVGGGTVTGRFVTASLSVAGHRWDASVGFCDSWRPGWALPGHDGFLRQFTLTVRAVDLEFELEPIVA